MRYSIRSQRFFPYCSDYVAVAPEEAARTWVMDMHVLHGVWPRDCVVADGGGAQWRVRFHLVDGQVCLELRRRTRTPRRSPEAGW